MAKNIIVFSDGTGQEGGKSTNTNVYKLFNMIEDRSERQVAFYDRGLGTGIRKVTGNVSGMGISHNILECYRFIFDEFNAGDKIFLFGFSRGATTVRSLSGFIHLFGVLPKSRPELIKRAYKIYRKTNDKERTDLAHEFVIRNHTMWCRVDFLGIWDTVAALGVPFRTMDLVVDRVPFFRHSFHDLRLSESVTHARHALAVDDERKTFHPTVWERELKPHQTMKQVWFCGMHTDVGGGYPEPELSDIALEWMVSEAEEQDLHIYPRHKVKISPDPDGVMHDSRGAGLTRLFRRKVRSWDSEALGNPTVHESVRLRAGNRANNYDPWILKMDHDVEPWTKSKAGHATA